jgi:hypothetical protein
MTYPCRNSDVAAGAAAGDIVAVELLPEMQWKGSSKTLPGSAAAAAAGDQSPGSDGSPEDENQGEMATGIFQV